MATRARLGNRRVTGKEQYYTPPDVADYVVRRVLEFTPEAATAQWLEPGAGTGAFVDALARAGLRKVTAIDIEPYHPKVRHADFLDWQPNRRGLIAVGNPPFGRNNALSVPFFNHAATMCDTIAFIVPRSWRKWSVTNRLDMGFECLVDEDLHVDYVDRDGAPISSKGNLRTCLQIWRPARHRRQPIVVPPSRWVTKCSPREADIAMRVFGYGCGTLYTDLSLIHI